MTPRRIARLMMAGLLAAVALPAGAAFYATPSSNSGPLNYFNTSQTLVVPAPYSSAPNGALLTFDLLGYGSLDGLNCCTDTFTLTINGAIRFRGGFDMGGGGAQFYYDPAVGGSLVVVAAPNLAPLVVSTVSYGTFQGGLTQFSVPHTLLAGDNTYHFDYGFLGDEGWGLRNVQITAPEPLTVPEPFTVGLLGLGLAGLALRRRSPSA